MLQTLDSEIHEYFIEMEKRWLCLARSYAEQLSNFSEPFRNRHRQNPQKRSFDGPLFPVGGCE
jgi:hypothetical protein